MSGAATIIPFPATQAATSAEQDPVWRARLEGIRIGLERLGASDEARDWVCSEVLRRYSSEPTSIQLTVSRVPEDPEAMAEVLRVAGAKLQEINTAKIISSAVLLLELYWARQGV